MIHVYKSLNAPGSPIDVRRDTHNALLGQAERAMSLLQHHAEDYHLILVVKGDIHRELGQYKMAKVTFRQAQEAIEAAERNGSLTADGYENWMLSLLQLGTLT